MNETLTAEQIQQHYSAAMDSVNLIVGGKPSEEIGEEEWATCVERNKAHLQIMLAKDFWTTQDLTPLRNASA